MDGRGLRGGCGCEQVRTGVPLPALAVLRCSFTEHHHSQPRRQRQSRPAYRPGCRLVLETCSLNPGTGGAGGSIRALTESAWLTTSLPVSCISDRHCLSAGLSWNRRAVVRMQPRR
jgi:hypothetical protein